MENNEEYLRYPIGRFSKPEQFNADLKLEWMAVLKSLPMWMDGCIENLDENQLLTPYRPGGWNTIQVIHHLADSHMNAYIRLKLALTEDNPLIKPYDEKAWATLADNDLVPVNVSVTLLHALHWRMTALLSSLSDAQWQRTYYHPEHKKEVAIWEMAGLYSWHSCHHAAHIMNLRQRMNW